MRSSILSISGSFWFQDNILAFISISNAGEYTDIFKAVIHISLTSSSEATKNCWSHQLTSESRNYMTLFYKNIEMCTDTKPKEVVISHFLKLQQRICFLPLNTILSIFFFFLLCSYFFSVISAQRNWLSFTIDFLWR